MQNITCVVDGKEYPSMRTACNHYGVNISAVSRRVKKGETIESAIFNVMKNQEKFCERSYKEVVVNDKSYRSLNSACVLLGKNPATIRYRLKKCGMTMEDAFNIQVHSRVSVTIDNVCYLTLKDACNAHQYNYYKIYARIYRGKTPQEAFDIEKEKFLKT